MEEFSRLYLASRHMKVPIRSVPHPGYWWQALIVLAYFTGLRVGDLLKAKWSDLNEYNGTLFTKLSKTGVEADLPLPDAALGHLARLERQHEEIFHIGGRRFYYYIADLKSRANLKNFAGFHDIRRTAGSEADRVRPGMGTHGTPLPSHHHSLRGQIRETMHQKHAGGETHCNEVEDLEE